MEKVAKATDPQLPDGLRKEVVLGSADARRGLRRRVGLLLLHRALKDRRRRVSLTKDHKGSLKD